MWAGFEMMERTTFIPFTEILEVLSEWYFEQDFILSMSDIFSNHDCSFNFSEARNYTLSQYSEISTDIFRVCNGVLPTLRNLTVL